ncbi:MarR family transcriptional regulator [Gryllotalpicola koreensis]|uniref:MarR family transcriptional regulator n=1 Tax=Gryllotalpicola koreensis TaxID=993086 RepID=A0ABP7ZXR7_9MICO
MAKFEDRVAQIQAEWSRERPELDTSAMGVIGRLHRLAAHLTDELTAEYRRHGLAEGDFDVLAALRRAGAPFELSAGQLAESTMITTGGMTKRLDRLEKAGLVTRRPSEADGRGRVIGLTPHGREVIDAAVTAHTANEQRLLAQVPERDRASLEAALAAWLAHYES